MLQPLNSAMYVKAAIDNSQMNGHGCVTIKLYLQVRWLAGFGLRAVVDCTRSLNSRWIKMIKHNPFAICFPEM